MTEVKVEVHKVAKMSKLNILSEAGREMNYCDQKFEYDKEITVTQQPPPSSSGMRTREILEEEISQGWVGLS